MLQQFVRPTFVSLVGILLWSMAVIADEPASGIHVENPSAGTAAGPVIFTTQQDHQNMQQQLGILKLRRGRDSDAKSQFAANYDEAKANPYPNLPDVLTLAGGDKVTSSQEWWNKRRPEIVELLEREVYGRIPANVPSVKWEVRETVDVEAGGKPAIRKHIVGVVDNSACPEIKVNISMSLTLPRDVDGPVPVHMSFGWTPFEPNPFNFGNRGAQTGPRPPSREDKLIKAGWGCAIINPTTVQDDSGGFQRNRFGGNANANADAPPTGAGLTRGIIGLTNLGQPRKPDDWGSLRAWGWGASRALDYLETVPAVDAKKVGIGGVSRYGKAALVTMAFDQRFGMGLLASSGAGGTKIFRRDFGETLENLASSGAYHWMTGNYLKYSADESTFGRRTADDLPVDSHMTLALCAPRLTFISHGIPERGDANWLDHQGSFMAAIAAQPVFRLLGARDLGRSDDYHTEKMPPVNFDILDGQLAWRQHDGGHTDEPNIQHFIAWANRLYGRPKVDLTFPAPPTPLPAPVRAQIGPVQRTDSNSALAHQQLIEKTKRGKIDVYFTGDSITRRWGATDYPAFLANWNKNFHGWNAANFGWGGDSTNNILWRMQNGELDGIAPKVFVLQGGTNNLPGNGPAPDSKIEEVVTSIKSIIELFQKRSPDSKIVLTAVFPRNQNPALTPAIQRINEQLEKLADGKQIRFVNIFDKLADTSGSLLPGMSEDGLHFTEKSYQVWADALRPILLEILGPPSAEDRAPPPTGDPSAQRPQAEPPSPRLTTPGAAEIPDAVRIKRPTASEMSKVEKAVAAFVASADPETKAVLKEYPSLVEVRPPRANTAVVPNLAGFFRQKHEANVVIAKQGEAEVLFLGDSITDFWRNESGPFAGRKVFDEYFGAWKVANFGIAGDTTQGVLYRLQHGEGEGFQPRAVMLMIGTNNTGSNTGPEIAEGIGAVVLELQKRFPKTNILLLAVFPRGSANDPVRSKISEINQAISRLHDDQRVFYMDIGKDFLDADGNIPRDVMSDALHPSAKGYEIWAKAVQQKLAALAGKPPQAVH